MDYNINNGIFMLFKKNDNDMLSMFSEFYIDYFLHFLKGYNLVYRPKLNIDDDIKFGLDIGFEHFKSNLFTVDEFNSLLKNTSDMNWNLIKDRYTYNNNKLISPVYTNNEDTWKDLEKVCNIANYKLDIRYNAITTVKIGSKIFGNNLLYWYRFLKLWGIYENIIYRFSYGEYLSCFSYVNQEVKPVGKDILDRLEYYKIYDNEETFKFICGAFPIRGKEEELDKNGLSFYNMFNDWDYDQDKDNLVIKFRTPISTFDHIILQNYVNFFVHLLLYCKREDFNDQLLNKRREIVSDIIGDVDKYDEIYLEQALELCDLIFDNIEEKVYFLKQYLKGMEKSSEKYKKAEKYTRKRKW